MNHNLVLTSSGSVSGFGCNFSQQLLLPSIKYQTSPVQLPIENILAVSVGDDHSLFLDHDGYVFCYGDNDCGQLGLTNDEFANRNPQIPAKITSLHNIISVSTGLYHSLFLDSNGNVFSCGYNRFGQLGHDEYTPIPTLIQNLHNIIAISAGSRHSVCLDHEGKAWSFGSNKYGQLGLNDNKNRFEPERIDDLPTIQKICAGQYANYTMMLDHYGVVWVSGHNCFGQLGLGDEVDRNKPTEVKNLPKILSISAGYHSIMLDENDEVWTCGHNLYRQLCLNDTQNRNVPTKINLDFRVSEIKAGRSTTLMVDDNGYLWGCGSNYRGSLGLGQIKQALVPTRIEGIEGEVHLEKIPERQRIASTLSIIE